MQHKKLFTISCYFLFFFIAISFLQCKKTTESIVDCLGESFLVSVHATTDASNSKKILLEAKYIGSHTLSNVTWEYGDGMSETLNTTTTTHTYVTSGVYTVKAKVKLNSNNNSCTIEPTKTITIP